MWRIPWTLIWIQWACAWEVTLFEHYQHQGRQVYLTANQTDCYQLQRVSLLDPTSTDQPLIAAGAVSSAKSKDGCIRLYSDDDCRVTSGFISQDKPCNNFEGPECPRNDEARSVSDCGLFVCPKEDGTKSAPLPPDMNVRSHTFLTSPKESVDPPKIMGPHRRRKRQLPHRRRKRQLPLTATYYYRSGEHVNVIYQLVHNIRVPIHLETTMFPSPHQGSWGPGFGSSLNYRFAQLSAEDDDHKGHLIANSLGGPPFYWNLIPQTPKLNKGNGRKPNWRSTEITIEGWLERDCHWVDWTLQLTYPSDYTRPYRFDLRVKYWNRLNGQTILRYHDYLVCYNDNDGDCTLEPVGHLP